MNKIDDSELPLQMWRYFNEKKWGAARELLSDEFEAYRAQSDETFVGPANFIEVNQIYPGTDKIQILDSHNSYDHREHNHQVTTEVFSESKMPDGKEMKLYAISFFEITDGKTISLKEYFADTHPAPDWLKHLVTKDPR